MWAQPLGGSTHHESSTSSEQLSSVCGPRTDFMRVLLSGSLRGDHVNQSDETIGYPDSGVPPSSTIHQGY